MIQMEPCSPLYALHATSDEKFSEKKIIARSNRLQVSVGSCGIFYELDRPNGPIVKKEIPAMNHLLDHQNYVETGCTIQKIKELREQSGTTY